MRKANWVCFHPRFGQAGETNIKCQPGGFSSAFWASGKSQQKHQTGAFLLVWGEKPTQAPTGVNFHRHRGKKWEKPTKIHFVGACVGFSHLSPTPSANGLRIHRRWGSAISLGCNPPALPPNVQSWDDHPSPSSPQLPSQQQLLPLHQPLRQQLHRACGFF